MGIKELIAKARDVMSSNPKSRAYDSKGQFYPDPTPMQPPVGYKRQPSLALQIREQVRLASLEAARAGYETLEEADDFDTGEDAELRSPYELDLELEVPISVLRARAREDEKKRAEVARGEADPPPSPPSKEASEPPEGVDGLSPAESSGNRASGPAKRGK